MGEIMSRTPEQIRNKIKMDRWWRKQQRRFRIPEALQFEVFLILVFGFIVFLSIS